MLSITGLLDRFRRSRSIDDPTFGTVTYSRNARLWEGAVAFGPTGESVDVLLEAGPEGPTASQRAFFAELSRRYPALLPELLGCVSAPGTEARRTPALELVCIDLQSPDMQRGRCELTLEDPDTSEVFSVELRSWRPSLAGSRSGTR